MRRWKLYKILRCRLLSLTFATLRLNENIIYFRLAAVITLPKEPIAKFRALPPMTTSTATQCTQIKRPQLHSTSLMTQQWIINFYEIIPFAMYITGRKQKRFYVPITHCADHIERNGTNSIPSNAFLIVYLLFFHLLTSIVTVFVRCKATTTHIDRNKTCTCYF